MQTIFSNDLLRGLPAEIVREHIIPFTYSPQSAELCEDIRNYFETSTYLYDLYKKRYLVQDTEQSEEQYEEDIEWLSNDITRFLNQDQATMYGYVDFFIQIYKRMYRLQLMNRDEVVPFIERTSLYPIPTEINKHIALMSPEERTKLKRFVNQILED